MHDIDQAAFHFSPTAGVAVAVMGGFLVFAVALDLKWEQFRRVLRNPRAPLIGLLGQFAILPAIAFVVGRLIVDVPSVALGLLLVACCPGGALSNYFSGIARGDVATSVSMTAVSTVICVVATPAVFAFWAATNPATSGLLQSIRVDPKRVVVILVIMVLVPVTAGMAICGKRPEVATRIRPWIRGISILVFATVVIAVLGMNLRLLFSFAAVAAGPVLLTFSIAVALGWGLARVVRLGVAERRAVTLEVGMQNVALAIGTSVAFFPALTGAAVTSALWGVVHLVGGLTLTLVWARIPTGESADDTLLSAGPVQLVGKQLQKPEGLIGKIIFPIMARRTIAHARWTADLLAPKPGEKVLEVGFGNGAGLELLAERVPDGCVTGAEISETAIDMASKKLAKPISQGRVVLRQVEDGILPFDDGTFSRACTVSTAYVIADPAAIFREMYRVLADGGTAAVTFPVRERFMQFAPARVRGFHFHDLEDLERWFREAGFSDTRTELNDNVTFGAHCMLGRKKLAQLA